MAVTSEELRAFFTGHADAETKKRIAEDLQQVDSSVGKMLDCMTELAKKSLEDLLRVDYVERLRGVPISTEPQIG